jgi:hypothetical protein
MTTREKIKFLQYDFIQFLRVLEPDTKPSFGKMNAQQMVEHFTWAVQIAAGKEVLEPAFGLEQTEKNYRWLMNAETMFKENTPNQLLPDEPLKIKSTSMGDAIDDLEDEIAVFVESFKAEAGRKVVNPFFGELDYYEQSQLLYKHCQHHMTQFGYKGK